jgi:hypothetical protein
MSAWGRPAFSGIWANRHSRTINRKGLNDGQRLDTAGASWASWNQLTGKKAEIEAPRID